MIDRNQLQMSFDRLSKAIKMNAPPEIITQFAISVGVRAIGGRSPLDLAKHIVQFQQKLVEYAVKLQDPTSTESAELAEIEKSIDDIELEKMALDVNRYI